MNAMRLVGRILAVSSDLPERNKRKRGRGSPPPPISGTHSPSDWPSRRLQDSRAKPL